MRPRKVCVKKKPPPHTTRSTLKQKESGRGRAQKYRPLGTLRPSPRCPLPPLANRLSRLLGFPPRDMRDIRPRTTTRRRANPTSTQYAEPASPYYARRTARLTTRPAPPDLPLAPHNASPGRMDAHARHGRRERCRSSRRS